MQPVRISGVELAFACATVASFIALIASLARLLLR
jgi:hypothetical protein